MQHINPARQPPSRILNQAKALAAQIAGPVYLYQYSGGWQFTEKIANVPSGALITEIKGNPDNPETWNTGGC